MKYAAKERLTEHGLQKSYWGELIIHAEWLGEFTKEDMKESADWKSCACGKLDDHIEVDEVGAPYDTELYSLGANFPRFVAQHNFLGAAKTLINIKQRSIELLGGDNE